MNYLPLQSILLKLCMHECRSNVLCVPLKHKNVFCVISLLECLNEINAQMALSSDTSGSLCSSVPMTRACAECSGWSDSNRRSVLFTLLCLCVFKSAC